jgi:hypothetical protein
MTPLYSLIPLMYPESVEAKIGIAEIINGLGYLVGPVIGSLLY